LGEQLARLFGGDVLDLANFAQALQHQPQLRDVARFGGVAQIDRDVLGTAPALRDPAQVLHAQQRGAQA
jgi:hypothetical protein